MNYKKLWIILGCAAFVAICAGIVATKIIKSGDKMENTPSKVYYVREITPENLIKIYDALGVELRGNVGIKVSTGEAGSRGYLKPELIGPLVQKLNGTIIECNTAYAGQRNTAADHLRVAAEHGFTKIANVDIMDADGEMKIPVNNGKHLKYNLVGTHLDNYDSILNLAHGKGHAMGGFGANLKNQSIGIASRNGKAYIHSAGFTTDPDAAWANLPQHAGVYRIYGRGRQIGQRLFRIPKQADSVYNCDELFVCGLRLRRTSNGSCYGRFGYCCINRPCC